MVARMMRWPRPPQARKFRVRLVVRRAEGLPPPPPPSVEPAEQEPAGQRVAAEVRWKGPRASGLGSLRRAVRRNRTRGEELAASGGGGGAVAWEEGFESVVTLAAASHREAAAFQPWELAFTVFTDVNKGPKTKPTILGTASLSLADYASAAEEDIEIILPLSVPCGAPESVPSLHLTLSMVELRAHQETSDASQRSAVATPLSPSSCDSVPGGKDEVSVIKAGLRKVKTLRHIVSARRSKKTFQSDEGSEDNCYIHSDGSEYPYGTEHVGEDLDDRTHEDEVADPAIRKSFSYGSLQSANYVSGLVYAHAKFGGEHEDWVYYSHRKSDAGYHVEQPQSSTAEGTVLPAAKRSILPWRKRKLGLRSLKAKGEPLLKKANGEEGGDDIDYDRRLLTSSDGSERSRSEDGSVHGMMSEFGDDNFVVGNWESKEVLSRDGHMRLSSQVFFASIDQRSERAAGASACTSLVAVIADWFQANRNLMPIHAPTLSASPRRPSPLPRLAAPHRSLASPSPLPRRSLTAPWPRRPSPLLAAPSPGRSTFPPLHLAVKVRPFGPNDDEFAGSGVGEARSGGCEAGCAGSGRRPAQDGACTSAGAHRRGGPRMDGWMDGRDLT